MSDEKVPDDAERDPEVGLWRQADEWLGQRHRVHLMWVAFLAGLGVFWLAQTQIFNPSSKHAYEQELVRQFRELNACLESKHDLGSQILNLVDSIDQINSYGVHLGQFEVGERSVKMVGGMLRVSRWNREELEIVVDSTPSIVGTVQKIRAPVAEGLVNPVSCGSLRVNLMCREVTDSTVTIDVYERR